MYIKVSFKEVGNEAVTRLNTSVDLARRHRNASYRRTEKHAMSKTLIIINVQLKISTNCFEQRRQSDGIR